MVHPNSIQAFKDTVQPELMSRKEMVVTAIKELGKASMRAIADHIGVPLHTISGRFSELQRDGRIKVVGSKSTTCTTKYGTFERNESLYSLAA